MLTENEVIKLLKKSKSIKEESDGSIVTKHLTLIPEYSVLPKYYTVISDRGYELGDIEAKHVKQFLNEGYELTVLSEVKRLKKLIKEK